MWVAYNLDSKIDYSTSKYKEMLLSSLNKDLATK